MSMLLYTMKTAVLFLLLLIAIHEAESQTSKDKLVCLKKNEMLKFLKGRDGKSGPPGEKGDPGMPGEDGFPGLPGYPGSPGKDGEYGSKGIKGQKGKRGLMGWPGRHGFAGPKGKMGKPGIVGEKGDYGYNGDYGRSGEKGERGKQGSSGKMKDDIVLSLLNDYYVLENGYYNNHYHVRSRDLTDGRTDTGGWGSKTAKMGNFIQASYVRPVYVKSITLGGGFVPSWGHETRNGYGSMALEFSSDGKIWKQALKLKTIVGYKMVTQNLATPVHSQYWRLISIENKWVGTTEFALKPLVPSSGITTPQLLKKNGLT